MKKDENIIVVESIYNLKLKSYKKLIKQLTKAVDDVELKLLEIKLNKILKEGI